MELILDTNAISAFLGGEPTVSQQLSRARQLALPAIVAGEYLYGLSGSKYASKLGEKFSQLASWCRPLSVDADTAMHYAAVRRKLKDAGRPIPENDVWIASLAVQHALPVLSRDKHFDFVENITRIPF